VSGPDTRFFIIVKRGCLQFGSYIVNIFGINFTFNVVSYRHLGSTTVFVKFFIREGED